MSHSHHFAMRPAQRAKRALIVQDDSIHGSVLAPARLRIHMEGTQIPQRGIWWLPYDTATFLTSQKTS